MGRGGEERRKLESAELRRRLVKPEITKPVLEPHPEKAALTDFKHHLGSAHTSKPLRLSLPGVPPILEDTENHHHGSGSEL